MRAHSRVSLHCPPVPEYSSALEGIGLAVLQNTREEKYSNEMKTFHMKKHCFFCSLVKLTQSQVTKAVTFTVHQVRFDVSTSAPVVSLELTQKEL